MMRIESAGEGAPTLVFGIGNPSRGDDAIGPLLIERLALAQSAGRLPGVDLLTDFQLQPEHALDLRGRQWLVVVDASLTGDAPFVARRLSPHCEHAYSTHSTSAEELLAITAQLYGRAPDAWLLAVRGFAFGLGNDPSVEARANLNAAAGYLVACRCRPERTAPSLGAV